MPDLLELALNFVVVGIGALAGSAFMWFVIGPFVIKRAAPKVVRSILKDTMDLTEGDIAAADGSMFKALTKKQGESFASAINGALGNLIQAKPDEELEALAKQYGFAGVEDAKAKILGGGIDSSLAPGIAGADPGALLGAMGKLTEKGGNNRFAGIVDTIALIQSLGALGGNGGAPALPGMSGLGNGSSRTFGW